MRNPATGQKVTIIATGQKCIVSCVGVKEGITSFVILTTLDELEGIKCESGFILFFSFNEIEATETDALMELLDANPPNDTEETPEPTQEEKELFWQADLEAHNRQVAEQNSFHS